MFIKTYISNSIPKYFEHMVPIKTNFLEYIHIKYGSTQKKNCHPCANGVNAFKV